MGLGSEDLLTGRNGPILPRDDANGVTAGEAITEDAPGNDVDG
jgi:hypothetical protein